MNEWCSESLKALRWTRTNICAGSLLWRVIDTLLPLQQQGTGGNRGGGGGGGGGRPGDVPLSGACHSAVWKRPVGDAVTLNGKFNKDNGSGSAE